jgi:hypothetical protein
MQTKAHAASNFPTTRTVVQYFAPFMVFSSAYGESRPIYEGVYTVGGHGERVYYLTWVVA